MWLRQNPELNPIATILRILKMELWSRRGEIKSLADCLEVIKLICRILKRLDRKKFPATPEKNGKSSQEAG